MNISVNKMVTLSYTLRSNDIKGEIIEQTTPESPLKFVFGIGNMLPMFESNLIGLKTGDNFDMQLKASEAYGEVDTNAIVELEKNLFIVDGVFDEERFYAGAHVPMQTSDGQRLNGVIEEISDDTLRMNFNHPLAGVDLHFTGNVIEVREATAEELAPAMGCGCSSSGCGSSDCGPEDDCSSGGCGSGCGC